MTPAPSFSVAIIATSDFSAHPTGGITSFVRTISEHFPAEVDVRLVGFDFRRSDASPSNRSDDLRPALFTSLGTLNSGSPVPIRVQACLHALAGRSAFRGSDVYYVHSPEIAAFLPRDCTPVVYQIHGGWTGTEYSSHRYLRNPVGGRAFRAIVNRSILRATYLAGVNEMCRDLARRHEKPYLSVPPMVDTLDFFPKGSPRCSDDGILKLGYLGRIDENKNVGFILQVAELIADQGQRVDLTIAGNGASLVNLAAAVAASSQQLLHVELIGLLPHGETPCFLRKVDVFMLASKMEGLPTVLLEAMASGCAVVAPSIPGVTALVVDGVNGLIYPRFDVREAADCVLSAYRSRVALSEAAIQTVQSEYSADGVARRLANHFAELVASGGGRAR